MRQVGWESGKEPPIFILPELNARSIGRESAHKEAAHLPRANMRQHATSKLLDRDEVFAIA